jgi:hypothetical protein
MLLRSVIIEVIKSQATIEWAKKLAGVFVVSFVAAAGSIWSRRLHREGGPHEPQSAADRLRQRNAWNRGTRRPPGGSPP